MGVVIDHLEENRKGHANRDSHYTWALEASYCQFVVDNVVAVDAGLLAPDAVQPMDTSRIPSVAVTREDKPHADSGLHGESLTVVPA